MRRSGLFIAMIEEIACSLKNAATVGIAAREKDESDIKRILDSLKDRHGLEPVVERMTRKEPVNNMKPLIDERGEMCGVEILEQHEVFTGWILKIKGL